MKKITNEMVGKMRNNKPFVNMQEKFYEICQTEIIRNLRKTQLFNKYIKKIIKSSDFIKDLRRIERNRNIEMQRE